MFQERTGAKDNPRQDLIYVALILVLIVFAKNLVAFLSSLPAPWDVAAKTAALVGLALAVWLFYRTRIVDYRYSLACRRDEEQDGEAEERAPAYAEGTVLFERMVANRGRLVERVEPRELVALIAPGEALPEGLAARGIARCSAKSRKKSHLLVYRRGDRLGAVRFSPSQALARRVREAVEAGAAR